MSLESNKSIAKKSIDLWSTGNLKGVDEIYSANCQRHLNHQHGNKTVTGTESLKKFIKEFRDAFPDFHDKVDDQLAEGDKVTTRFTSQGTHQGKFMGIDPTNKKAKWSGIVIDRIENGKIVETWVHWDLYGLLDQLGLPILHHSSR